MKGSLPAPHAEPAALALRGVAKSYPGVRALKGVDFTCARGEVHALLGENGAGKSTLVNVASGNLSQDEGTIEIGGVRLDAADPARARKLGLAIAYQDDSLIPDLSVADNLLMSAPPCEWPARSDLNQWAASHLQRFATEIDPAIPVRELPVAARQVTEIVKALLRDPSILILDEPTAALTAGEAERLHILVREAAASGTGVVYITHRLAEALALADRISVLRDGEMVAQDIDRDETDQDGVVALMVGRSLDTTFPSKAGRASLGEPVLTLESASGDNFTGVTLEARAGEILGLAGVEGNGQREVLRALAGLKSHDGELAVHGARVKPGNVRAARRAGISFVSGDRRGEAVFADLSIRDNMTAGALGRLDSGGIVTRRRERAEIQPRLDLLALRSVSEEHPLTSLSGGNQQKVALGRALLEEPEVYLVEEPTQGVDAATRVQIYRLLREESRRGAVVIVLSSDALELAGLCDRVAVISRGHVVATFDGDEVNEDRIVGASVQAGVTRAAADAGGSAGRLLQFARRSDFAPVILLLISIAALMAYVSTQQSTFLSTGNIGNLLFLAVPLGFAALGQAAVMMTGGIDLSIGPLVSLTTVVIASIMSEGNGMTTAAAIAAALGVGLALGLVNALLVRKVKLQPLIATLATYVVVQGLALLIMATPGGYVSRDFATAAGQLVGFLPVAFLALVAIAVVAEFMYRRRLSGLSFRAVGSRASAARRIGVKSEAVYYGAIAGIFFAATIQIGDATLGISFTLASVTAVVLGGMSTWGGRGSIVGAVGGAVLLAAIANGSQYMGYPPEIQYYIQGGLLIGAIAVYSKLRATGRMRDETVGER
jgi:ribose transport system ATP-binding protein